MENKGRTDAMRVKPGMSTNLVSAGSYVISGKKRTVLAAILGTCVGVTLCDRVANVGGLIHLLLPEPTNMAKPWRPEKYASTGFPIFIKALREAGAARERMQACIAGGGLIDPVCEPDFFLILVVAFLKSLKKYCTWRGYPLSMPKPAAFLPVA